MLVLLSDGDESDGMSDGMSEGMSEGVNGAVLDPWTRKVPLVGVDLAPGGDLVRLELMESKLDWASEDADAETDRRVEVVVRDEVRDAVVRVERTSIEMYR